MASGEIAPYHAMPDVIYSSCDYLGEDGEIVGHARVLTIPIPWWKDLKWAKSAQGVCNPMQPRIGYHFPQLVWRRRGVDPTEFCVRWKPWKVWPVR